MKVPPGKQTLNSSKIGTEIFIGTKGQQPAKAGIIRIPLDHAGIVGDHHCNIKYGFYENKTTITAVGPTYVNGKRLSKGKRHVLPEVRGGVKIELKSSTGSALAAHATTLAAFKFEMHTRVHNVIKRASENEQLVEVRDHCREISGEHCKIYYHQPSNTFKLVDISRNGVYVNKTRVTPHTQWPIAVGSVVAIGGSVKTPVGDTLSKLNKRVFAFVLEAAE